MKLFFGFLLVTFTSLNGFALYHNTATVVLKENTEDLYFHSLRKNKVIRNTHLEAGNIYYEAFAKAQNSQVVVFNELWNSSKDLDLHLQTPHMVAFFKSINFNPNNYNILENQGITIFTIKDGIEDFVIEKLTLEGFTAQQLK